MRSSRRASHGSSRAVATRTRRRREASSGSAAPASRSSSTTDSRPAVRTRHGAPGSPVGRPFVTYKVAATVDGRVTVPGARWVTGEASRRLVHELPRRLGRRRRRHGDGLGRCPPSRRSRCSRRPTAAAARFRSRAAAGRLRRSSCAPGPLADELAALGGRGRAVAPPRGRADARDGVPGGGPRRQAARVRRADARRGRAARFSASSPSRGRLLHLSARPDRRGRAPRGVPATLP